MVVSINNIGGNSAVSAIAGAKVATEQPPSSERAVPVIAEAPVPNVNETKAEDADTERTIPEKEVRQATEQVTQFFQSVRRELQFREDAVSGRTVISVVDSQTGEIIRQIPPEQVVRVAENLDQVKGLLLGESV